MRKKLRNIIITVLFCLAIFLVPALFLLTPKEDFSEREKRYLAEMPAVSAESVADGTFTEKLGVFVADHFPGRELFVGINAYYDLFAGRQETKDYLLSRDGRLFSRPTDRETDTLNSNLGFINDFSRDVAQTGAGIPVSLMLVPSSGAVLLEDADYPDAEIISYAYEHAQTGHVDLLTAFRSAPDPGRFYYRTDHHWTSEGAFQAACAYRRSLGLPCPVREDYTRQSFEPFYGSAYAASGLWLTEPDSLELWYSGSRLQVTNETGQINDGVFYHNRLEEQDKYQVYLDGNHSLVRIENLSRRAEEERSLLVIRDSFSNSLGCFLADLYDKVILVDLRYYRLPLTELLLEEGIDEILIEYSVDNFLHDANLAFLSVDPEPLLQQEEEEQRAEQKTEEEAHRPPNYYAPPTELTEEFFDGAYYLGDSVLGILSNYCIKNDLLVNTTFSSNAELTYNETVHLRLGHLIYKGHYATLPDVLNDLHPPILIAALGCNDLASFKLARCEEIMGMFLEMVHETDPDITVFVQSVMPIRVSMATFNQSIVDEFNAWLKDNTETYDYCYIELDQYFKGEDGQLAYEHMNNATHLKIASAPYWYEQFMNVDNYYHFPEQYYVEYDGLTNLPVEAAEASEEAPEPPAPVEPVEPEPPEETVLDEIYAQICGQVSCPEMLPLNERTVASYLGLQPEEYLDGRFYLCANNLKADEIWLMELEDEAAAQSMRERAQNRITVKADSYQQYLPEESAISRRGIAVAKGRFVGLFVSPDAEKIRDIFLAALE
ncbi:MAG: DUF4358 domain-containing protein [Oscillospiraceae bacterium]|nr:DUF4358 domain-containing protein [Oscillospiraceae bacterium]